ncbi:MAG: DUF2339 domain-containing protein, partial [Gorillibacterium sp.]|nr:DUF2339 domain-containing protein [Gorillibacterium sp.]
LGQVLLGGAFSVLILSLFAAHILYDLISPTLACVLYLLSIGMGLYPALRHRSEALLIITMLGGYLIPFLVHFAEPNMTMLVGYETLFSIAMILLAFRYAYFPALYIAYGVLHLPLLVWSTFPDMAGMADHRSLYLIAILLQHLLLYILLTFGQSGKKNVQPAILFVGFGVCAAWAYNLYPNPAHIYPLTIAALALAYSLTAGWLSIKKRDVTVYLAVATFGWMLLLINLLDFSTQHAAIAAEGTIALLLGLTIRNRWQQATGFLVFLFGSSQILITPIGSVLSSETFSWLVLMASLVLFHLYNLRLLAAEKDLKPEWIQWSKPNTLLWILSALFLIFITQITNIVTDAWDSDLRHLVLSTVWLVYAITIIAFGVLAKARKARFAGILLLFFTLLKVIFIDLPDVSMAVRAILFLGLGGIGVAVSRLFYTQKN